MSNKNCNTPPPHFWLKELPEDKDLCPNAIYFIKKGSKVEIYVTDKNSNEYTIEGSTVTPSDSIQSIISPNGTISISESGGVVGIDIAQNIIDQINSITGDKNYVHEQNTPSKVWVCNHNLNKFPSPIIIDSAGSEVEGAIEHIDKNTTVIRFNAVTIGAASFN